MTAKRVHREKMLRDDIFWLETRIEQLEANSNSSERRLARCYHKLLQQRQLQLNARIGASGTCVGCWPEYFA